MSAYKISLLIPVYNTEKYLKRCLDSVLNQTLKDIEIICVNDGSNDHSLEILKEYQSKYGIKVINSLKNEGLARARYHGIVNATGEYIMFLDSDDYLQTNACEIAYKRITHYKVDILQFGTNVLSENHIETVQYKEAKNYFKVKPLSLFNIEILNRCYFYKEYSWNLWNKIYRASLVKSIAKYIPEEKCIMAEDIMIYFFISFFATSFKSITNPLINYQLGSGVSTSHMTLDSYKAHLRESVALKGIEEFLLKLKIEKNHWLHNIYNLLKNDIYKDLIGKFIFDVNVEDGGQAFDLLMEKIDIIEFIEHLSKIDNYSSYQLFNKISRSKFVKHNAPQNIKNLGIFYYRLSNGGVERVISKIIPLFIKMGYHITFFVEQISEKLDYKIPKEVTIIKLPKSDYVSHKDYLDHAKEFKLQLISNQIDLMLYQASVASYLGEEILICKSLKIPFVITTHDFYSSTILAKDPYMLQKRVLYSMCEGVQTITKDEEYAWKKLGVKAKYIPNPLTFNIKTAKPSRLDNYDILWVGRIQYRQKCPDQAIYALREVVKVLPQVKLHIVGTAENKEDLNYLKKLIKNNQLEKNIILEGYCQNPEIFYSKCSLLLMTSSYEVYPMVLGEAMTYGLPIVLYDLPYVELLKNTKCYLSSPQLDFHDLANNIITVLTNDKIKQEMSLESKKKILEVSNIKIDDMWRQFFDDLSKNKLECDGENSLSKIIDISYQHMVRADHHDNMGVDHPGNYFNLSNQRYRLIDTLYPDRDTLYGLLLKDKSRIYKAYFFLTTNPKLFFKKMFHISNDKSKKDK